MGRRRQQLHPSALRTLAAVQTYCYGDVRFGDESGRSDAAEKDFQRRRHFKNPT